MPVTVCWAAKGGSGTTVVAAALALACPTTALLVDADGELPAVLGLPEPDGQGLADWLASDAPAAALADLTVEIDAATALLPRGSGPLDSSADRWRALATWLSPIDAVVDVGTGPPPAGLLGDGARSLLVTRGCYLALRRAATMSERPHGAVVVVEPGRALGPSDVARALGVPVVATVSLDPAVARAVDAGLLAARLPRTLQRELRRATVAGAPRRRAVSLVGRPAQRVPPAAPPHPGAA